MLVIIPGKVQCDTCGRMVDVSFGSVEGYQKFTQGRTAVSVICENRFCSEFGLATYFKINSEGIMARVHKKSAEAPPL